MPKRTPEQKLARQIQQATGRKYCDCLREARERIKEETCPDSTARPTA